MLSSEDVKCLFVTDFIRTECLEGRLSIIEYYVSQ